MKYMATEGILLKIGNDLATENIKGVAAAISEVFKTGFESHVDQETIKAGLDVLVNMTKIENVNISNNNFQGGDEVQAK